MTVQIDDFFRHNGIEFSVSGISEGELFNPSRIDLKPSGVFCTACYRGYQATFAVSDSYLVLDTLHVNLVTEDHEPQVGPQINGVTPTVTNGVLDLDLFNNHYEGLDFHLEYSGGLLIADGLIHDLLYVHVGVHSAWKYTNVIELIFANGILQQEFDRSERMAEIREMIQTRDEDADLLIPSNNELREFMNRSFDRTYRKY